VAVRKRRSCLSTAAKSVTAPAFGLTITKVGTAAWADDSVAFPILGQNLTSDVNTPKHAGNTAWEGGDFHISKTISSKRMRSKRRIRSLRKSKASGDFRISEGPVVSAAATALGVEEIDLPKLPQVYESPWLFAIARDPDTIFCLLECRLACGVQR